VLLAAAVLALRPLLWGAELQQIGLYALGFGLLVLAPGWVVAGRLLGAGEDGLARLARACVLGFVLLVVAFSALQAAGHGAWIVALPVAAGLLHVLGRRRGARDGDVALAGAARVDPRVLTLLGLLAALVAWRAPMARPGGWTGFVDQDLWFHAGNAAALARSLPFDDPRIAGEPLAYHFFGYVPWAALDLLARVPVEALVLRVASSTLPARAPAAGLRGRTRARRSPWAGVLAAAFVLLQVDPGHKLGSLADPSWQRFSAHAFLKVGIYHSPTTCLGLSALAALIASLQRWLEGGARARARLRRGPGPARLGSQGLGDARGASGARAGRAVLRARSFRAADVDRVRRPLARRGTHDALDRRFRGELCALDVPLRALLQRALGRLRARLRGADRRARALALRAHGARVARGLPGTGRLVRRCEPVVPSPAARAARALPGRGRAVRTGGGLRAQGARRVPALLRLRRRPRAGTARRRGPGARGLAAARACRDRARVGRAGLVALGLEASRTLRDDLAARPVEPPEQSDYRAALEWIREHAPPDAVVCALPRGMQVSVLAERAAFLETEAFSSAHFALAWQSGLDAARCARARARCASRASRCAASVLRRAQRRRRPRSARARPWPAAVVRPHAPRRGRQGPARARAQPSGALPTLDSATFRLQHENRVVRVYALADE
jgi:hypothetical protein